MSRRTLPLAPSGRGALRAPSCCSTSCCSASSSGASSSGATDGRTHKRTHGRPHKRTHGRPPALLWVARPSNGKTGRIPSAYVGATRAETVASCEGCSLLHGGCYFWEGQGRGGLASVQRAAAKDPERYTVGAALAGAERKAKAARIGAGGDPARADRAELLAAIAQIRSEGMAVLGYTHHHADEPLTGALRRELLASCDTLAEADEALRRGWVPAVTVAPELVKERSVRTPGGASLLVCPEMRGKVENCNACRLCDPRARVWESGRWAGIAFPWHGPRGGYWWRKRSESESV